MKRNVWIMTLLLIVSSFSMELIAQDNLDALIKKCETMPSVDMKIVRRKNPETKKIELQVVTINICENPELIKEFVAAFKAIFEKDKENIISTSEDRKGGQIVSLSYIFENSQYLISKQKDKENCTTISITPRGILSSANSITFSPQLIRRKID